MKTTSGCIKTEGWLVNKRNQKLKTVTFSPSKTPLARLLFHHGLAEHCGRYEKVFSRLSEMHGIEVHSFDAHGHGESEPQAKDERALVWSFSHLLDDLALMAQQVKTSHVPLYIGGHSMGGLVAAHLVKSEDRAKGLVLHSPALDVEWTLVLRAQAPIGNLMAQLMPKLRAVPAVRPEDLSPDPAVVQDYLHDPLVTKGDVCFRTANELLKAFKSMQSSTNKIRVPVFCGHGTHDKCTSLPASRRFVNAVSLNGVDATLHEYPGGYHELLHGPEWIEATDRIAGWILKQGKGVVIQSKL
jgi:acylglycerol lipase